MEVCMIDKIKDAINLVSDLDVKQKLIDAQKMMIEMQEENQKLREDNKELKKMLDAKQTLSQHASGCLTDGTGKYFCPNCERNEGKIVQMQERAIHFQNAFGGTHECPNCKFKATIS